MINSVMLLISLFFLSSKALTSSEISFLSLYFDIDGFPLNTTTVYNACSYPGIYCNNDSIYRLDLNLCGGINIVPTTINTLPSLTSFIIRLKGGCIIPPQGTIPSQIGETGLLNYIGFPGCNISGTLPTEIILNTGLIGLLMNDMNLSGNLPNLGILTMLQLINFENNKQLSGKFPDISNLTQLQYLKISGCNFNDSLPDLSLDNDLIIYDVSGNKFDKNIPVFNSTNLISIDLSNNKISTSIPDNMIVNSYQYLFISMKSNAIIGTIPSTLFNSTIVVLDLSSNFLSGTIPHSIVNIAPNIQQIILDRNNLTGTLPSVINGIIFPNMFKFSVSNNKLTGDIPSFGVLNVTAPRLSVPSLTIFYGYIYLEFNDNNFSGYVPNFDNFLLPTSLDFSNNQLKLNKFSLGDGGNITWLNLGNNDIDHIDDIFSNSSKFTSLLTLDLSYNKLNGSLPKMLRVKYLKLNNNFYSGDINDDLIDPAYVYNLPVFIDLNLNRLNMDSQQNYLFGTRSTQFSYNTEIVLTLGNQVKDDCNLGTHNCQEICVNLYNQSLFVSHQCGCNAGNFLTDDLRSCIPCSDNNWKMVDYPANSILFKNFRSLGYNNKFIFDSCSDCFNGFSFRTRSVISSSSCSGIPSSEYVSCSFACSNLSSSNAETSIYVFEQELLKNNFLNDIMLVLLGVNVSIVNNKRDNSLVITPSNCSINMSQFTDIIATLSSDIIPNAPNMMLNSVGCSVEVQATDPSNNFPVWAIIIIAVISTILSITVLVISLLFYYYLNHDLHYLPKEINWSYLDQVTHPWSWDKHISGKNYYYSKLYQEYSDEYNKVNDLLTSFCGNTNLEVTSITAVYNPNLTQNFINTHKVMSERYRSSYDLFYNCTYKKNENKLKILKYFNDNIVNYFPYNDKLDVKIVPCLHGTSRMVSGFIAMTNNAILNNLDAGFYGSKSIYFTTKLYYTLPYVGMHREGAVVISHVICGNVFACDEDHNGPNSLMGKPVPSPYNSNFVLTNKKGLIYKDGDGEPNNEIIIPNDNQSVPAYIVTLDFDSVLREFKNWEREIINDKAMTRENLDCVIDIDDQLKETI